VWQVSLSRPGQDAAQVLCAVRHQAVMYSSIETTKATNTHNTIVRSIQLPKAGEPGSAFLNGTTANNIAAYHVVIGD
jgi:hypothetical protein